MGVLFWNHWVCKLAQVDSRLHEAEGGNLSQFSQEYVAIQPSQATEHVKWAAKYGFARNVLPENRRTDVRFLLYLPLPRPFLAQAYRCSTCRHGQLLMDHVPIQEVRNLPPDILCPNASRYQP